MGRVVLVAGMLGICGAWPVLAGVPANDLCADATPITSLPFSMVEEQIEDAKLDPSDPYPPCTQGVRNDTVWYTYTAAADTDLTISTAGSDFDSLIWVGTGNCGALTDVTCAWGNAGPDNAELTFTAQAGVTYRVMIGSFFALDDGTLHVTVDGSPHEPTSGNDSCSTPAEITSVPQTITASFEGATSDADDVAPPCYPNATEATLWYSFTPSSDQQVRMDTTSSDANTTITVFTGECGALVPIDCDWNYGTGGTYNHGMVDFFATGGTTYRIMISSAFQPPPTADAVLTVTAGLSHPVTVEVREADTAQPIEAAHVWIRDTVGGNYTLRSGFTDAGGKVTLYPPMVNTFESHAAASGRIVDAQEFVLDAPTWVTHWLDPMGPVPEPSTEPARLAFSQDGLRTMLGDGTDERLILDGDCFYYPTWSPDGSKIVFGATDFLACGGGTFWGLWTINADGSGLQLLSDQIFAKPLNIAWSPDGQWITYDFFNPSQGYSSIHKVNAVTGEGPFLLKTFGSAATWSPDGSMIAYASGSGTRIMHADGSNDITISVIGGAPDWSPDGDRIAVAGGSLFTFDIDGSDATLVTEAAYGSRWSPDSDQLVFNRDNSGYRINADGTGEQGIRWNGLGSRMDWASQPTYDVPGDGAPKVSLKDPDGGEWLKPGEVFTIEWDSWDDNGIAFQDLYLLLDEPLGDQTIPIALGLPGSQQSYAWTVPDIWSHLGAKVRIAVTDSVGQDVVDETKYWFSISDGTDPYVMTQITYPQGGELFQAGDNVVITWELDTYWTATDMTLELSTDGGFTFSYINPFVPADTMSYNWIVPADVTSRAVVRIRQNGVYSAWAESGHFGMNLAEAHNLRLDGHTLTELTWDPPPGETAGDTFDVVRGNLATLTSYPGDPGTVSLGAVACIENDAPSTDSSDEQVPPPGEGWFYVVRPGNGTYGMEQPGERVPAAGDCSPN